MATIQLSSIVSGTYKTQERCQDLPKYTKSGSRMAENQMEVTAKYILGIKFKVELVWGWKIIDLGY